MPRSLFSSLIQFIFFGNYFYGLCAVALSIEASLQQQYPLNVFWYYLIVFLITVLFYTKAYLSERISGSMNQRSQWYTKHFIFVKWNQIYFAVLSSIVFTLLLISNWKSFLQLSTTEWIIILVFPLMAFLYYGVDTTYNKIVLRNIGWLKPFIIGFVWAGIVTVYPVLFYNFNHSSNYEFTQIGFLLFIKNLMFIAMLCVLFDIKDYATDSNEQLKTFVVKSGLRKTIFSFVIPMSFIGWGSFVLYGYLQHFHPIKIVLNTIPFLLLILIAYSLHKPKSIFYYLILIDGLMLAKAICGSVGMVFF